MAKVLIVEDDLSTIDLLKDLLLSEHYTVEATDNGKEALYLLENYHFDLAIVDWELPELAGVDVIQYCRDRGSQVKFLILTGRRSTADKVRGLDCGSDDYLTKPFDTAELSARIRALLRRQDQTHSNIITCGVITLDMVSHQVRVEDQEIKLQPTEYALLEFFLRHPNQAFSNEAILERVWKAESDATDNAVRTCVARLRKKLGTSDDTNPRIVSLHGFGYRLECDRT